MVEKSYSISSRGGTFCSSTSSIEKFHVIAALVYLFSFSAFIIYDQRLFCVLQQSYIEQHSPEIDKTFPRGLIMDGSCVWHGATYIVESGSTGIQTTLFFNVVRLIAELNDPNTVSGKNIPKLVMESWQNLGVPVVNSIASLSNYFKPSNGTVFVFTFRSRTLTCVFLTNY